MTPGKEIAKARGIAHVALHYRDITKPFNFFTTALGMRPLLGMVHSGYRIAILASKGSRIELIESPQASEAFGSMHLAFSVRCIDQALRHAAVAKYQTLSPIRSPVWGLREVDLAGPGGLMIQLVEKRLLKLSWSTLRLMMGGLSQVRQFPVLD